MKDKGWMMKDRLDDDLFEGFKLLRGFDDRLTDICECRVAFATEKHHTDFSIMILQLDTKDWWLWELCLYCICNAVMKIYKSSLLSHLESTQIHY